MQVRLRTVTEPGQFPTLRVEDAETGELINGVRSVTVRFEPQKPFVATLDIFIEHCNVRAEGICNHLCPICGEVFGEEVQDAPCTR